MKKLEELKAAYNELGNKIKELESKKKVGRLIPEIGERYYRVGAYGDVYFTANGGSDADKYLISISNCFRTEEEAEEHKEKLIFNQSVIDRIAELNGDWEYKEREEFWLIMFDCEDEKLEIYNLEILRLTSKEKLFKSKEIGETILKEFDNDKLIKWFI